MPTNVGSVVASVVPDVSGFTTQANASLTPSVERLGKDLGKTLSRSLTGALDFSGIDAALRHSLDVAEGTATLKGRTIGQRYGRALRAAVDSELGGIQNSLDVRITPVINRDAYRAVQADLDVLTRPRTVAINADADTRVAADELANLVRARTATVNANADTTAAAARLAELARSRTATVRANVNSSQVAQASSLISRITSTASSAGGAVAGLASKVALLGAGAPVVGSLVNVVAAIAPAAALAIPAVAALGSAFGAIKLGTSGIGDALKAAFAPASASASKAASSANQMASAEQAVKKAVEQVGVAQENAAAANQAASRSVASAERDLTSAQVSAKQAQQDLNDARVQAKQDLLDLQNQLKHGALDERAAALAVQEAKIALDKVLANPNATELQRQEAQLAYDQAAQNLDDQKQKQKDLQAQEAAAQKAGVEGSKGVLAAKQAQAQATQDVKLKEQALSDARTAQAKTARDGARSIADAQQAVADAQQRVAEAQASAADQTSALDQALAKLSPNARGFVASVQGLAPAWDAMKLGVQDRLFAGIGSRLSDVGGRVIPILRSGLTGTAGVLNTMGKNALTAVDNLARTGTLKKVFDGATSSLRPLSRIPGQLVTGFGQVAVAAQPAFQRVTTAAGGVVDRLAAKLSGAFSSGGLEKAINTAVDLVGELGDVGKNVFSILGSIFEAGAGTGGGTIGVLKTITAEIAKIASSPEVQGGLKALFGVMGQLATTVAPLLGTALKFVGQIFEKLGPPVNVLIKALGAALTPVIDALGPVLVILAQVLGQIVIAVAPLIVVVGQLLAIALKPLTPVLKIISGAIAKVAPLFAMVASVAGKVLTPILLSLGVVIGDLVKQYAAEFLKILKLLLPVIPQLVPPLIDVGKQLGILLLAIAPLLPQIMMLSTQLLVALLPALLPLLPPLFQLIDLLVRLAVATITRVVLPAIQGLINFVKDMGHKLQPFIDAVKHVTEWIHDKFVWLYDVLVGHSVIPDMINAITGWFTKGRDWIKGIWNALWDNTIGRAQRGAKSVLDGAASFAGSVRDRFNNAKSWATSSWSNLWSGVSGTVTSMRRTIEGKVGDFKDNIIGFFKSAVSGVGTAWGKLQGVAKAPVKFLVQTVFNDGLRAVWNNTAARLPGIGKISAMTLPKGFATGGILPGYTPGRDVHRFVSPTGGMLDLSGGEAIMRPEVTRAVGRGGIHALNAAARQGGVAGVQALLGNGIPRRAFWGGGIWDDVTNNPVTNTVKSGVKGAVGAGADLLHTAADWARGGVAAAAEKTLKTLLGVSSLTVNPKDAIWSKIVGDVPVVLASKIVNFIRGKEDSGAGSSAALKGYSPSAGVKQWIPTVLQALALVNQPSSLLNSTLRRMQQESGGNPTIVNTWDSNWQAGHPSVGLMQVIAGTFRAYAGAYKNRGPFSYGVSVDPLANIYSSMRYALSAYSSLSSAYDRAGGYANGGYPQAGEVAWVGEQGPELVRFRRPAQVYPHQESMRMARQMSAQSVPAARQQQAPSQVVFNATTTDRPTRQTVMNALSDYGALHGPLVIPT
jgi:SLT domain-containing protein/phage-related protein